MPDAMQTHHQPHQCNTKSTKTGFASLLAVTNSKLLTHAVLVDILVQAAEVIAQRAFTLLADIIHIHGGIGSHDGGKLGSLAVLQGQLAHQADIPTVAKLDPNSAQRIGLHGTAYTQQLFMAPPDVHISTTFQDIVICHV